MALKGQPPRQADHFRVPHGPNCTHLSIPIQNTPTDPHTHPHTQTIKNRAFSLKTLSKECNGIFTEFHDAFERGDVKRLAALCTEDLYLNLKVRGGIG